MAVRGTTQALQPPHERNMGMLHLRNAVVILLSLLLTPWISVALADGNVLYLNNQNISVALGASMPAEPFANRSTADSLASIIDAPSADAPENHSQSTHVWVSGGALELDFDFGMEYDLKEFHFWNYFGEGFDVDNINLKFFDSSNSLVGSLNVTPQLGGGGHNPIFAENFALSLSRVQFVNAVLTGSNNQVDFNNIGFSATVATLDHFLTYKMKLRKDAPPFQPLNVNLADQFETGIFAVKKPKNLGNPADKNSEGINDPNIHLETYPILLAKTDPPQPKHQRRDVQITNQFGALFLTTIKPDRLLVPTAKSLTEPVDPPNPDSHNVDHFKCYKVKIMKGASKFPKGVQASVADQFTDPAKLFDIKKPTRLCTPVSKNGEQIKNPERHLVCYRAKPAKGQPKHQKRFGVFVNNQFGPGKIDSIKEDELCLPSTKILLGLSADTDPEDADDEEVDAEEEQ